MSSHPYIKFRKTKDWKTIEKALKNLVKNNDLILQTRIELIIGYLVQCLENDKENPQAYQKKEKNNE